MDDQDLVEVSLERLRSALETERVSDAVSILTEMHPADQAEVFNRLDEREQDLLLPHMTVPDTAALLEEMEDRDVLDAVDTLTPAQLADILDEMEPDEAADLLGDLPPEQVSQTLAHMEDASEVIPLLGYPDETAGGLMTTSYVALRRHTPAEQAIQFLRQISPEADIPYFLYVVDREKHLMGVVGLRELVISSPGTVAEEIMDRELISVETHTDQEEVARIMGRYDLTAIPVVDEQNRLVGVITHDDIVDVLEDETTEDILHLGGVETGPVQDKPYWSQHIWEVVRSRFMWLLILFVAQTFTGTVLRAFESQLQTVVALSFFIPLLIGTGGNSGSQTVATVIRALSTREMRPRDAWSVWWREVRTALLLGVLLGLIGFIWALMWGVHLLLAITVGLAITTICVWANSVAAIIPLIASAVGIDPTIVSGPLMTTLIDGTGLLIYFTLASLILPEL